MTTLAFESLFSGSPVEIALQGLTGEETLGHVTLQPALPGTHVEDASPGFEDRLLFMLRSHLEKSASNGRVLRSFLGEHSAIQNSMETAKDLMSGLERLLVESPDQRGDSVSDKAEELVSILTRLETRVRALGPKLVLDSPQSDFKKIHELLNLAKSRGEVDSQLNVEFEALLEKMDEEIDLITRAIFLIAKFNREGAQNTNSISLFSLEQKAVSVFQRILSQGEHLGLEGFFHQLILNLNQNSIHRSRVLIDVLQTLNSHLKVISDYKEALIQACVHDSF